MALMNFDWNFDPPSALPKPQASVPAELPPRVSSMLRDYQGAQYDPATLFALQQQVFRNLDPYHQGGGAWSEAGQNIGFDYNDANGAFQAMYGRPMTVADQVSLDMARQLYSKGITDLSQIKRQELPGGTPIEPVSFDQDGNPTAFQAGNYILNPQEVAGYAQPRFSPDGTVSYGFLPSTENQGWMYTGPNGERLQASLWDSSGAMGVDDATQFGSTYTGDGGTFYNLVPDGNGGYKFATMGAQTDDFNREDAMGILAVLATAFGGAALAGEGAGAGAGAGAATSGGSMGAFGVGGEAGLGLGATGGAGAAGAGAAGAGIGGLDAALAEMPSWATTGVDAAAGLGEAGAAGAGNSLYSLSGNGPGSAFTGQGLQVAPSAGTSLELASTTGAPGIQATLGPALGPNWSQLVAPSLTAGGLGLSPAIAGSALIDAAGLGNGLAYSTGTLLGPAATAGTYMMADGTLIPGFTSTGVPITPDFPFTPPPGAPPPSPKNPLTDKLVDKLTEAAVTAGLGALAGGAGGGGAGGTDSGTAAEDARQKRIQDAIAAINEKFGYGETDAAKANRASRDAMYGDLSGAVRDTAMRDVDRQYTRASRQNLYGLARSGILGGSADAEAGGELQTLYGEGRLKSTQAGQQSASDLRTQDERSRQNLITMAQGGLDVGTAGSLAAGSLSSAADLAKSQAAGANAGRLFDDMGQAYVTNEYLRARYPNGMPQQGQGGGFGGSQFAPSKYAGKYGSSPF